VGPKDAGIAIAAVLVIAAVGLGLGFGLIRDPAPPDVAFDNRVGGLSLLSGTLPQPARGMPAATHRRMTDHVRCAAASTIGPANDTWAYDSGANAWTKLSPSGGAPTGRFGHSMAYDPVSQVLVMFGGFGDAGTLFNDTWAYDSKASVWTDLKPSGTIPTPRGTACLAYDSVARRLIMFGGSVNVGPPLNDTWAYDSKANVWTDLKPSGAAPPPSGAGTIAYDPGSRRLIMFGGFGETGTPLNETWAYDSKANVWTNLRERCLRTRRQQ
jgi:N-acetylneuraminic acid mutarotase